MILELFLEAGTPYYVAPQVLEGCYVARCAAALR